MKKILSLTVLAALLCNIQPLQAHRMAVEEGEIPEYTYVETAPPEDLEEEVSTTPGANYFWVKGHWRWQGRWIWVKGHWHARPHENAEWTPGHWFKKHHHWIWVPGHWQ